MRTAQASLDRVGGRGGGGTNSLPLTHCVAFSKKPADVNDFCAKYFAEGGATRYVACAPHPVYFFKKENKSPEPAPLGIHVFACAGL